MNSPSPEELPNGTRIAAWVFLRSLGVIYFLAFASLAPQVAGLFGSEGILPAEDYLASFPDELGGRRIALVPTLFWLGSGDFALSFSCGLGITLSILLIAGVLPLLSATLLWLLYLSFVQVGGDFLSFQWDMLLIETGLLALFLAPPTLLSPPSQAKNPSRLTLLLFFWLLFRLIFASGVVKLASGDPAWRSLTALAYHFETQPLPPWTAWYAHHFPAVLLRSFTASMFLIELLIPFLIFAPARVRRVGFGLLLFLQAMILATGNYGFFNWITIALCLLILDDHAWPRSLRRRFEPVQPRGDGRRSITPRTVLLPPFALIIFTVSLAQMSRTLPLAVSWPASVRALERSVAPYRSINSYGLFAIMTTSRPEIIIEGSNDGIHWLPYEFAHKIGDPEKRPAFVAPHMPRLDWQMWFQALSSYRQTRWYVNFLIRLLEGSEPVLGLLESNPFPDGPPRQIRAAYYNYRFSDPAAKRDRGVWWTRDLIGYYSPPVSLRTE